MISCKNKNISPPWEVFLGKKGAVNKVTVCNTCCNVPHLRERELLSEIIWQVKTERKIAPLLA
jgi:hypothetical protein